MGKEGVFDSSEARSRWPFIALENLPREFQRTNTVATAIDGELR